MRHTARPLADSSRPRSAGASALNKVRGGPGRRVIPGRGDGRTHTERRESITVAQIPHEGAHGGHRAGAVKETSDRSKGRKRLDIDAAAQLLETGVSGAWRAPGLGRGLGTAARHSHSRAQRHPCIRAAFAFALGRGSLADFTQSASCCKFAEATVPASDVTAKRHGARERLRQAGSDVTAKRHSRGCQAEADKRARSTSQPRAGGSRRDTPGCDPLQGGARERSTAVAGRTALPRGALGTPCAKSLAGPRGQEAHRRAKTLKATQGRSGGPVVVLRALCT